jgi:polysaccharide biosynthesis protein PelF
MRRLSVLLTTEATYPFHQGGVSTWCHTLTHRLPEIDFRLLAVIMHPFLESRYPLPPNVCSVLKVPLWGTEDPVEYSWHQRFSVILRSKWKTTEETVATRFRESFERLCCSILSGEPDPQEFGETLLALHNYFQKFDYQRTMKAKAVWSCFQAIVQAAWRSHTGSEDTPSLAEITEALRLLYRFLSVLHYPVPETDLTHSSAAGFCGLPCILAKLQRGTPYLLTEHGVYLREQYLNLRRNIPSAFVRWFLFQLVKAVVAANYHFADQISPVCSYNTRWERWRGVPSEKIQVIYNGVNPERFRPMDCERGTRPVIVNMGLIFPLKGQLDLIEAAARVRAEVPNVLVRLYGSASDDDYFRQCREKVTALGLEQTVSFCGSTSNPCKAYCEADVVAFASVSEAFPYAVIEAMLSGAAVVATDVGGVGEAVAETGILVPPRRPAELAQALIALLGSESERARLGAQARNRALQFFAESTFLEGYRGSYERLASVNQLALVLQQSPG